MLAKKCLDGTTSGVLSESYSISARQIRYWAQIYAIHGSESFLPTLHSCRAETKLKALQLMWTNGWSLSHTSAVLNLSSPSTLAVWLKKYNEAGIHGLKNHCIGRPPIKSSSKSTQKPDNEMTLEELREELAYLRAENDVLKKFEELEQKKREQIKKKRLPF